MAPWPYVEDTATATVAALEHGRGGEAYNICDDEAASWLDVITELARVFDAPRPMVVPGALVRLMAPYAGVLMTRTNVRLSTAKARDELDWKPSLTGYRDGLARTREIMAGTPDGMAYGERLQRGRVDSAGRERWRKIVSPPPGGVTTRRITGLLIPGGGDGAGELRPVGVSAATGP